MDRVSAKDNVIALWQREGTMANPMVSEVVRYWDRLRGDRVVPDREEIDPRVIQHALSHAFILDRPRPETVRFRLAGAHLNDLMGMEVRGMPLRAFFEIAERRQLMQAVEQVFSAPATLDIDMVVGSSPRGRLDGRMTLLPLRSGSGEIDRALGILVTEGRMLLPPHRFAIREMVTTPVGSGRTASDAAPRRQTGGAGFAEAQAPFAPHPTAPRPERVEGRPVFTVLDGGKK